MVAEQELTELRREYISKIESLERQQKSFMKRISIFANCLIPGLGFLIYGKGYLKGVITFLLFCGYIVFHLIVILPSTDFGFTIFYLLPAFIVWIISIGMLASLD